MQPPLWMETSIYYLIKGERNMKNVLKLALSSVVWIISSPIILIIEFVTMVLMVINKLIRIAVIRLGNLINGEDIPVAEATETMNEYANLWYKTYIIDELYPTDEES